jgi:hypothetical protein
MLKLRLKWELEDGSVFEEWTRPVELSMAERELFNGKSVIAVLRDESAPSNSLMLFLAHKIQQRLSDKPIGNLDQWSKKVVEVNINEFEVPKDSTPTQ